MRQKNYAAYQDERDIKEQDIELARILTWVIGRLECCRRRGLMAYTEQEQLWTHGVH